LCQHGTIYDAQGQQCVSCNNNTTAFEKYSSAVGQQNTSTGLASFVAGSNSIADGDYSIVLGGASEARSWASIAIGFPAMAYGSNSIAIGGFVKTIGNNSIIMGEGANYLNRLENSIPHSLMIGFKSTKPTFFIGESPAQDKTGKVAIGDLTDPQAKLHIKTDIGENVALRLEPWSWTNDNYSEIQFGDNNNKIRGTCSSGLGFYTPNNFVFHTGKVGIGITPTEKLHVNGNIKATGFILPESAGEGRLLQSDAEGNASWAEPAWRVNGGNVYREQGKTGIGTDAPLAALHIAQGDIYLQDIESGIIMKSPDGRCWRGVMNNGGELEFSEAVCPENAPQATESASPANGCRIYPNPAKGKIIVETGRAAGQTLFVEITDMRGAVCYAAEIRGSRHTVSTEALPAGYYTVRVTTPAGEPVGGEKIAVHK